MLCPIDEWNVVHTENEFAGLGAFIRPATACAKSAAHQSLFKTLECLRSAWSGRAGILVLERLRSEDDHGIAHT